MGLHDKLATEEATKNALIMPFIAALGYDVFDPTEVVPELVADVDIKFTVLVRTALGQVIRERVTDRLRSALQHGAANVTQTTPSQAPVALPDPTAVAAVVAAGTDAPSDDKGVVTTEDEILGYQIVRAIVCSEVGIERVFYRDAQSYFSVLLDDNKRKPICRLHFNAQKRKYLGIFDAEKNETRHPIERLDDIYKFGDALRETVREYREVAARVRQSRRTVPTV